MANETNGQIIKVRGRLSFIDNLVTAEKGAPRPKGKHAGKIPYRHSMNVILDGSDMAQIKEVGAAINRVIEAEWPDPDTRPKLKADKKCLRNGDEESYAGYAGNWYVSAAATVYGQPDGPVPKRPFKIIGRNKVLGEDGGRRFPDASDQVYAGCVANVILRLWAQDSDEYGKRVNASIEAVQFWEDGPAFGGGPKVDVDSAFDEFGGEDGFDDEPAPAARADKPAANDPFAD